MQRIGFHERDYDAATLLKLEIFRGYVREWLPVFLSKKQFEQVHIYDFFAGPGMDAAGNPGSPLVILNELRPYLSVSSDSQNCAIPVHVHFNDVDPDKINALEALVDRRLADLRCKVEYSRKPFSEAFEDNLTLIQDRHTANLVIIDQCGIKEVNESIFRLLIQCSTTDLLFFISSSIIRRFITEGSIQQYFPIAEETMRGVKSKHIHRYICHEYYRKQIPHDCDYFVAPFSIEKDAGANIYGVIFGSSVLLGLEKFLEVCWRQDTVTGEANYSIDDDLIGYGYLPLLPEDRDAKKLDVFRQDVIAFIGDCSPDNRAIYRFTLESGFLPKHTTAILRELQGQDVLLVTDLESGKNARKNSFYLAWKYYKSSSPRVRLSYKTAGLNETSGKSHNEQS